ncbi:MAG: hypothetical protein DHS20C06_08070 [Hyphobacterium sp.]|nr:MAG: hypothetical protein DHS20C06_08070 [Hyphobacterium sp.]
MLGYMILFVLLAIVAGYFGFFALAGIAAWVAKALFLVAILAIIIRGVGDAARGRPPV